MPNFIFSLSTSKSPPNDGLGSLQSALKVIVESEFHVYGKAAGNCAVHAPALVISVVTRAAVTTTPTPKLFVSLMVRVLSAMLLTTIVFLLQLISAPKLHLSGRSLEGFRTPKYAKALIIINITKKAHPYVVKNSNAACDLMFIFSRPF